MKYPLVFIHKGTYSGEWLIIDTNVQLIGAGTSCFFQYMYICGLVY